MARLQCALGPGPPRQLLPEGQAGLLLSCRARPGAAAFISPSQSPPPAASPSRPKPIEGQATRRRALIRSAHALAPQQGGHPLAEGFATAPCPPSRGMASRPAGSTTRRRGLRPLP